MQRTCWLTRTECVNALERPPYLCLTSARVTCEAAKPLCGVGAELALR